MSFTNLEELMGSNLVQVPKYYKELVVHYEIIVSLFSCHVIF